MSHIAMESLLRHIIKASQPLKKLDNLCVPPKVVLNVLVPGLASLLKAAKLGGVQATEDPDQCTMCNWHLRHFQHNCSVSDYSDTEFLYRHYGNGGS